MPPIGKSENRKSLAEKAAAKNKVEVNFKKMGRKAKETDKDVREELDDKSSKMAVVATKRLKDF